MKYASVIFFLAFILVLQGCTQQTPSPQVEPDYKAVLEKYSEAYLAGDEKSGDAIIQILKTDNNKRIIDCVGVGTRSYTSRGQVGECIPGLKMLNHGDNFEKALDRLALSRTGEDFVTIAYFIAHACEFEIYKLWATASYPSKIGIRKAAYFMLIKELALDPVAYAWDEKTDPDNKILLNKLFGLICDFAQAAVIEKK